MDQNMPPPYWGHPQGPPPNAGGSAYGGNPQFMPAGPPRQHDTFYAPADLPPLDKQPHQGFAAFGRDAPMGINPSSNAPAPPPQMISQVTSCYLYI